MADKSADRRVSIYLGTPLIELLGGTENRSGRLNNVAERYLLIKADELWGLNLTYSEWCAIMDANNGFEVEGDTSWQRQWANVMDSPEIDDKWGVSHTDLAKRMRAMSVASRAAVYEATMIFWANADLPTEEALVKAGITKWTVDPENDRDRPSPRTN